VAREGADVDLGPAPTVAHDRASGRRANRPGLVRDRNRVRAALPAESSETAPHPAVRGRGSRAGLPIGGWSGFGSETGTRASATGAEATSTTGPRSGPLVPRWSWPEASNHALAVRSIPPSHRPTVVTRQGCRWSVVDPIRTGCHPPRDGVRVPSGESLGARSRAPRADLWVFPSAAASELPRWLPAPTPAPAWEM